MATSQLNGRREVEAFLNHLAVNREVSASTQNQAFNAILFLYREVLDIQLENIDAMRAHERKRLPTVLSRNEVAAIMEKLDHPWRLMVELLHGSGLRLHECCTLRIKKNVDTDREQITLRATKGNKDRLTLIPSRLTHFLSTQIEIVTDQHQRDLSGHLNIQTITNRNICQQADSTEGLGN